MDGREGERSSFPKGNGAIVSKRRRKRQAAKTNAADADAVLCFVNVCFFIGQNLHQFQEAGNRLAPARSPCVGTKLGFIPPHEGHATELPLASGHASVSSHFLPGLTQEQSTYYLGRG